MKKVIILGSTGMLGSAVGAYFEKIEGMKIYLSYRNEEVKYGKNVFYFDPLIEDTWKNIPELEDAYVINCIGTIKPFMDSNIEAAILINSHFPHRLATLCKEKNAKLIHITTDCVFSGREGEYTEESLHDALDSYGKSKSIGEPVKNAMVIRTSIIGPEIHKDASLVAWVKSMAGKDAKGFLNHFWNGVTTKQYAKVCEHIIREDLYEIGLFHVFSPQTVNKHELLQLINDKYALNINISAVSVDQPVDRTLSTIKDLNGVLRVPSLVEQIEEM